MLKVNLFQSVARFVKEYDYNGDLFAKSFTEYIANHYRNCFIQKPTPIQSTVPAQPTAFVGREMPKSNEPEGVIIGFGYTSEPTATGRSCIVSSPVGCTNENLIGRYNELRFIFTKLSPRLFLMYLGDLDHEFMTRFGKSPFRKDEEMDRIAGWGGKLIYLSSLNDFMFIPNN